MAICSVHETWAKASDRLVAGLAEATFDRLAPRGVALAQE